MEELNKKLLKFAGFDWLNNWGVWRYPDETHESNLSAKVPDFPNDLNACFKHLRPKAIKEFNLSRIEFCYSTEGNFDGIVLHRHFKEGIIIQLMNREQETLALCLAIEKLIDGESDVCAKTI